MKEYLVRVPMHAEEPEELTLKGETEELNAFGNEGWTLVAVRMTVNNWPVWYLERERDP